MSGHTVIVVPVPEVDDFVRERTAYYDDSFLSTDPRWCSAHLTLLGPWVSDPSAADLDVVARLATETAAFDYTLERIETFPDGTIHLRPSPDHTFRSLTHALVTAFADYPPYRGQFPDPVPHVTLDREAPGIDAATVAARFDLPIAARADRVDVQWWTNHDCRVLASWDLGR